MFKNPAVTIDVIIRFLDLRRAKYDKYTCSWDLT
jgi:hypothetical protein